MVTKKGFAGGVSRLILNLDQEALARWRPDDDPGEEHQEWRRGELAPRVLRDDQAAREPLVIVLKRGLDLNGRVIDKTGQPVRGQEVVIAADLHYGSHTGVGGGIFGQEAVTDPGGWFHFRHVYPNVFDILAYDDSFTQSGREPPYWIKTRVRGRWFNRPVPTIRPRNRAASRSSGHEKSIAVRLMVARRPLYHYFGRVTDQEGRPVARTTIIARSTLHPLRSSWAEGHDQGQATRTDKRGNYSLRIAGRSVDDIRVGEGGWHGGATAPENEMLTPGKYDFTVHPNVPDE